MSKPVKTLIRGEYTKRLAGTDSLAVIALTGIDANTTNKIRGRLADKQMRVTVVKNSLARQAFGEMGIDGASGLLEGPCAIVYGGESVVNVVRELLAVRKDLAGVKKDAPNIVIKGAFMEGTVFPADQIDALSQYPTRLEAIGRLVACVLSPGGKLVAAIKSPASKLAGVLKAIEEKAPKAEAAPAA
jgi:large subunit ribosomal protein L10